MFKKLICLATAAILTVTAAGCGGGGNKPASTQIHYEEQELGGNPGLMFPTGSRVNSKDQLVVYDNGDEKKPKFVLLDGEGKTVGEIPCSFTGFGEAFALDSLDNIYTLVTNPEQNGNVSQKLVVMDTKGATLNTLDLGFYSNDDGRIGMRGYTDIAVDSAGKIYLADPKSGIKILDKTGAELKTIELPGVFAICLDSDGNPVAFNLNPPDISLNKIDAGTGKTEWKQPISVKGGINMGNAKVFWNKTDKCVYLPFGDEILKYDTVKKSISTALKFSEYSFLASGLEYFDMVMDSAGNIYITANEGMTVRKSPTEGAAPTPSKYSLFKYTLAEGSGKGESAKVITLVTRREDRFLSMAAGRFQKENPGYRIEIEAQQSDQVQRVEQKQQDLQNYANDLNTRILSGKGPDIFMSDMLPYENYISKNMLADLGSFMANDRSFKAEDYYTNILDAFKTDGKMYMLPVNFSFSGLIANKKILEDEGISIDDSKWTWDDFRAIAGKLTKKDAGGSIIRTALPNISCMDMLDSILFVDGSKFVDRSGKTSSFDSPEFISILNVIKDFGDPSLAGTGMKQGMPDVLEAAERGSIVFYPTTIQDYMNYSLMKTAFKDGVRLLRLPSDGGTQAGAFSSDQLFSISSSSKYRDQAWEFLKLLLSEEIQSQADLNGFSVNKAAQQSRAQQTIDMTTNGNVKIMMKGASKAFSPQPLTQADVDFVNGYIPELTRYSGTDDKISQIVKEGAAAFFSGGKSVGDTVKLIQDKVRLYLGE